MVIKPIRESVRNPDKLCRRLQRSGNRARRRFARRLHESIYEPWNPQQNVHERIRVQQHHSLDLRLNLHGVPTHRELADVGLLRAVLRSPSG